VSIFGFFIVWPARVRCRRTELSLHKYHPPWMPLHLSRITTHAGQRGGSDDARILQLSEIIVTEMRAAAVALPPAPLQIYRVPEAQLAADKGAYQPTFMPLGPYHRGDSDSAT
uniref:Uncharacterized protein n=1 Tax=Aegilops tauschii subsp. strangulata TaxID=200361 RepID=A0A453DNQ0_AEGTS